VPSSTPRPSGEQAFSISTDGGGDSIFTAMIPPRPLLVLVAPLLAGCIEGPCTLSVEWAVLVEIRDAVTGTPIAELARGSVRDGSYVDSLRPHGTLDGVLLPCRAAASEREGIYTVEVVHEGYVTWQRASVRVGGDDCHVETVTVKANLESAP
jgi:hypothetical protein